MIFVTVGTHEQPFNRLLKEVDNLIENGVIKDDVFAQIGYSDYVPKHYKYSKFLDYTEMQNYFLRATVVITHGGPSSFMEAIKLKKVPIVVPRQEKYGEHINNHQLEFCEELKKRNFPIVVVENIANLNKCIIDFNHHLCKFNLNSNNQFFCETLLNLIKDCYEN